MKSAARMFRSMLPLALLALLAALPIRAQVPRPPAPAIDAPAPGQGPGVSVERLYRMAAKVRPLLLFWLTRDNVGGARITWHHADDGARGWELLIGSDPLRAPMKVNRWGYVREDVNAAGASMMGVMKQGDDESLDGAKTNLQNEARTGYPFKMIRARVADGQASSVVRGTTFARDFTYRDLGALLDALQRPDVPVRPPREVRLPAGVKSGFLVAVADLLHDSVYAYRRSGAAGLTGWTVRYIYNGTLYELGLQAPAARKNARYAEHTYPVLLDGDFWIRNMVTGDRESFSIVYGVDGVLAEVPVFISYQPKWWFKAELVLDEREKF